MSREKPAPSGLTIVVIIINLMLIVSLIKNAWGLYQARHRLDRVKDEVSALEEQKSQVEWQAQAQTDPAALDQVIRNKLNLAQPGETVIVIAGDTTSTSTSSSSAQTNVLQSPLAQWWQILNP